MTALLHALETFLHVCNLNALVKVNNNNNNNNNAQCLNYHTVAEGDLSLHGCDTVYIASGHLHDIRRL
jgi:hypothetical protein